MAKDTKSKILDKGVEMWLEDPSSVNAHAIARKIEMTHGAILYHFPNVRDAVAEHAVKIGNEKIICQLIACGHKAVSRLTTSEKTFYLAKL